MKTYKDYYNHATSKNVTSNLTAENKCLSELTKCERIVKKTIHWGTKYQSLCVRTWGGFQPQQDTETQTAQYPAGQPQDCWTVGHSLSPATQGLQST